MVTPASDPTHPQLLAAAHADLASFEGDHRRRCVGGKALVQCAADDGGPLPPGVGGERHRRAGGQHRGAREAHRGPGALDPDEDGIGGEKGVDCCTVGSLATTETLTLLIKRFGRRHRWWLPIRGRGTEDFESCRCQMVLPERGVTVVTRRGWCQGSRGRCRGSRGRCRGVARTLSRAMAAAIEIVRAARRAQLFPRQCDQHAGLELLPATGTWNFRVQHVRSQGSFGARPDRRVDGSSWKCSDDSCSSRATERSGSLTSQQPPFGAGANARSMRTCMSDLRGRRMRGGWSAAVASHLGCCPSALCSVADLTLLPCPRAGTPVVLSATDVRARPVTQEMEICTHDYSVIRRQRRQRRGPARCPRGADRGPRGSAVHLAGHQRVGERHAQPRHGPELLRARWRAARTRPRSPSRPTTRRSSRPRTTARRPVEYVLVGLASCLTAGVAAVAQNRGIQLNSVKATVEGDMDILGILGGDPDVRNGFNGITRALRDRRRREPGGDRGPGRAVAEALGRVRRRHQPDQRHVVVR